MKGNLIIGQSGGPTSVINSSLAGVIKACWTEGIRRIYGMHYGIEGFLNEDIIDLRKQIAYTLCHRVIVRGIVMEYLSNRPEQSQNQQNAHEWRQMSNGLEDGHKAETTNTKPKDNVALRLGELTYISLWKILLLVELAMKLILQDECRYEHRDERRNKDLCKHALSGDNALNPKHDGCHVTNWRECTS